MITLTIIALIVALVLAAASLFVPNRYLLPAAVIIVILLNIMARVPA